VQTLLAGVHHQEWGAHPTVVLARAWEAAAMPATERTIKVVTVDDQAPFRAAARALVDHTPGFELVGESTDGAGALRPASTASTSPSGCTRRIRPG
jgi:hypothetical protein